MQPTCPLCGALQTSVLHETAYWRVALNRNQNLLGKLIVVLRRHVEDVTLLSGEEWADLRGEVQWATDRLRRAFAPDHVNYAFLQNQDRHVHLHVIPRYAGVRRIAGLDLSDPDYPDHYRVPAPQTLVADEVLDAIETALTR